MTIGERIYSLRTKAGLSQEEFSEMLCVSRQSVSKWETDSSVPELDKLLKICDIFSISLDEMTGRCEAADSIAHELKKITSPDKNEAASQEDTGALNIVNTEKDTDSEDSTQEDKRILPKKKSKKILIAGLIAGTVSLITAFCILSASLLLPFSGIDLKELWWEINGGKIQYTYVLVHGLGGWGENAGITSYANYWGGGSDDLVGYLKENGYDVTAPSLGPVSSTWDRACELYAQLTGTTVDYGKAHAEKHGHERFGRKYTVPLIENWGKKINGGQTVKINLIGHSFGGATARLLTSLLQYGCDEEISATGKDTSPLFTGGKGNLVHSVTTLCAPHNGSSLTEILDGIGKVSDVDALTELLISLCFMIAENNEDLSVYDFNLEHFGINADGNDKISFEEAVEKVISSSDDHAGYDLSPDGAAQLNKTIKTVDSVYYYSYSYCTTTKGQLLDIEVPKVTTLPVLSPFAIAMGSYDGVTSSGIAIDKTWRANDGLVNVISAKYPFGESWCSFSEDMKQEKGVWYVMPVLDGDHGTVIGLNSSPEKTHAFWLRLFEFTDSLPR